MSRAFAAPNPGDIVWCRFPEVESIHPGPKSRPALVLSVMEDVSPVRVRIAYGTSQKLTPVRLGELLIRSEDSAAYKLAGLARPTKFSFRKVVVVPYTSDWFELAPMANGMTGATPRLGLLHPMLIVDLKRALQEIGLVK